MKYVMRQDLFAFGDDFTIKDESGREVYTVDGRAFTLLRQKLAFLDANKQELAFIRERVINETFDDSINRRQWTAGRKDGEFGKAADGSRYEAGSLIHEPAGSVHTLVVFADNTEPTDVVFVSNGANVTFGPDGSIIAVSDTESLLVEYYEACDAAGLARPTHIEA